MGYMGGAMTTESQTDNTEPTIPDELDEFKREARDALWDYFGIADKNDLKYFENIAEVLYPLVTKTIVKELESFMGHSNEIPEHVLRSRIAQLTELQEGKE